MGGRTGRILDAGQVEALRGAEVGARLLRHAVLVRVVGAGKRPAAVELGQARLGGLPAVLERLRARADRRGREDDHGLAAAADLGVVARADGRALGRGDRDGNLVVAVALCARGEGGRGAGVRSVEQLGTVPGRRKRRRTAAELDAGDGVAGVLAVRGAELKVHDVAGEGGALEEAAVDLGHCVRINPSTGGSMT